MRAGPYGFAPDRIIEMDGTSIRHGPERIISRASATSAASISMANASPM